MDNLMIARAEDHIINLEAELTKQDNKVFKLKNSIRRALKQLLNCQDKDAIFKRYIRENQSLGGHGIGLSIVKDICDKYDIKIEVISLNGENIFSYTFLSHISHT